MLRRISIVTLVLCGIIASMYAPLRQTQRWAGEYSIIAVPPSAPVQNSDSERRERQSPAVAIVQSKRQIRKVQPVAAAVRQESAMRIPLPEIPRTPLTPELQTSSPRAPPSVC